MGICLGHQAIAEHYGAGLFNMEKPLHGIASHIRIMGHPVLFEGIDTPFLAGRYHSWCVAREGLPDCLAVTAVDDGCNIMSVSHRRYPVHGVQFHPESFLTGCGKQIVSNFLKNG